MPVYVEIVDDLVHRHAHVATRKMFGMDCFTANGKAAGGLSGEDMVWLLQRAPPEVLILRPGPSDETRLSAARA